MRFVRWGVLTGAENAVTGDESVRNRQEAFSDREGCLYRPRRRDGMSERGKVIRIAGFRVVDREDRFRGCYAVYIYNVCEI